MITVKIIGFEKTFTIHSSFIVMTRKFFLLTIFLEIVTSMPEVRISDGNLRGIPMTTFKGRQIAAFFSIPYAKPPLGSLRFMPPQKNLPWNDTRDASKLSLPCSQLTLVRILPDVVVGVEDCLFVNVYTPIVNSSAKLPVIHFISPGSFAAEISAFGPRYLLDHDIVLVTSNYRVGPQGFLSAMDSVLPGNMGMKDQVAVLKWIKNNIAAFGGDPDNITLAGLSAGGSSIQLHALSRLSRGICESGTSTMASVQQKAPVYKFNKIAATLNCDGNDTQTKLECLQTVSNIELTKTIRLFQDKFLSPLAVFGPVVEGNSADSFLTDYPYELLRSGQINDVPMIFSSVSQEGLFPLAEYIGYPALLDYVSNNWNSIAPQLLDFYFTVPYEYHNETSDKIYEFYLGNEPVTNLNIVTDRIFVNDIETSARLQAATAAASIYYYRFSYRGASSLSQLLSLGVSHTDDLQYLLNVTIASAEKKPRDKEMIQVMSGMWASFATSGIPNINGVNWEPMDQENALNGPINYLEITSPEDIYMNSTMHLGQQEFWNSLPFNEPWSGRLAL